MTRYLSYMNLPLPHGSPKQIIVMREFKKMIMSVVFVTKHCFSPKAPLKGLGYSKIQYHLKHQKLSCKNTLYVLASTYTVINPLPGVLSIPLSPKKDSCGRRVEERTEFNVLDLKLSRRGLVQLQQEAVAYTSQHVLGKRNRSNLFCNDEELNKI